MAKRIVQDIKPNPRKKSKPEKEEVSSVVLSFKVDKNDNYEIKEKTHSVEKERTFSYTSNPKTKNPDGEIENDSIEVIDKHPKIGKRYDHLLRPIQYDFSDHSGFDEEESISYSDEDEEEKVARPKNKSGFHILNPFSWFRRKPKAEKEEDQDELEEDGNEDADENEEEEDYAQEILPTRKSLLKEKSPKISYYNNDDEQEDLALLDDEDETDTSHKLSQKKGVKKYLPIIISVFGIVLLFIAIMSVFQMATITIKPKKFDYTLDLPINLKATPAENDIALKVIEFNSEDKIEVEGQEAADVAYKSEGQVTLYNSYSKSSQYLLTDTRLIATNALIYKIKGETVIPGYKTDSKGVKTPGQVTVTVIAEFPGAEYNQPLTDFSILGFRGTDKAKAFYGRSSTEMKGGFKGKGTNITDAQKSEKSDELRKQIETKLLAQAKSNIPEGSILLDSGYRIEYGDLGQDFTSSDKKVVLSLSAKFYGIIFNIKDLQEKILSLKNVDEKGRVGLEAKSFDEVQLSIENPKDVDSKDDEVLVKLKGNITFIYNIDQDAVKTSMANRKASDFKSILQTEYNNVESASISMRPPWLSKFPSKIGNIKVKINE